jgi:hypothetical protein
MVTVTNRKEESKEGLANQGVENVKLVFLYLPTWKFPCELEGFQAINYDTKSVQSSDNCKIYIYRISYRIFGNSESFVKKNG